MVAADDHYDRFRRAIAFLEGGHPAQAAHLLEMVRKHIPGKGSVLEALGRAYVAMNRHDVAAEAFAEALEVDPANHYAHLGYGLCLWRLGDRARARGHLRIACAMNPENDEYKRLLGIAERSERISPSRTHPRHHSSD